MTKHILSKSTYIRGLQCHKSLYLNKHHPEWRDKLSAEQLAIFNRGIKVGKLAQKLFPNGKEVFVKRYNYLEAIETTLKLINEGQEVIYEAAFKYNDTLVLIDILVKKDNKWFAYEVKSSLKITNTYLQDAALQYYVIKNCLPDLADISIVYVNATYVKKGKIDLQHYFAIQSVKLDALKKWNEIDATINTLKSVVEQKSIPAIDIGTHCFSPYTCDFKGQCWKQIPANTVFDLAELSAQQKFEWYAQGKIYLKDLLHEEQLSTSHKIQIIAALHNEVYVDKPALKKFISTLKYPLAFIDFEAYMPAVPVFDGNMPYEHLPFLFSMHYKMASKTELLHQFFLADVGIDPREQFLHSFLKAVKNIETLVIYDSSLEVSILKRFQKDFPQFKEEIEEVFKKIVDIKLPFEKKWYYKKEMQGSLKLKTIADAVIENSPFKNLNIGHGASALAAYEDLQFESDLFKIMQTQEDLKNYCTADTLAITLLVDEITKASE